MIEKKLGILGGGQLGAMLIQSGISLGIPISVLELDPQAPCRMYATHFVVGDPLNYDDVMRFGESVDVLTIEKEAVNVQALFDLREKGKFIFPSPETIGMVQDKWKQKQFLVSKGIPVVPGLFVKGRDELRQLNASFPLCLKLCRDGYDGHGVMVLRQAEDINEAFDAECVVEQFVPIAEEISVIVARNETGEIKLFDAVSMVFDTANNILDYQLSPARISPSVAEKAKSLAIEVAQTTNLIGIVAVEMFVLQDSSVLVNELAPRPHNSGHHSIEACLTSQYEQVLRAVLGLPLGDPSTLSPSAMVNVLGKADRGSNLAEQLRSILSMKNVHIHWYGKKERKGRKLGHITILDETIEAALLKATTIKNILNS
ncbi:MAG: 5-(carboxyamino)imidazole ribonucleotide synthase [Bacteroidetes bacterium]|nr:5-(carboxyamino)imidazole ribonucleotide synthase [Bacteroidota bacterium]